MAILAVFFIFLFSILGMSFFMGKFKACNYVHAAGKAECRGVTTSRSQVDIYIPTVWGNPGFNFDNILEGILCLFEVCSTAELGHRSLGV